jgi:glycosyltransferase involved in cell wall biosynthesis
MFMADGAHPELPDALVGVQHRRHLVWVGRMMPRKGCELAVEAFARALPRLPSDERLILIGDGPERGNVERAVKRNGLERRIEMAGTLPHEAALGAMGHARALVFSSLRDAFGGVALEAAERATPTVWASHRGIDGLRTWLPQEAGWSRPVSRGRQFVETLADGMVAAATDPDPEWSAHSRAAYGFARDHSWGRRGDQMVDLYRRLLEEQPSHRRGGRP